MISNPCLFYTTIHLMLSMLYQTKTKIRLRQRMIMQAIITLAYAYNERKRERENERNGQWKDIENRTFLDAMRIHHMGAKVKKHVVYLVSYKSNDQRGIPFSS